MSYAGKKEKLILYTAVILLGLTLISSWLTSNLYAKYMVRDSGSDGARVAKFEVSEQGKALNVISAKVSPGYSTIYDVEVFNKSETAITYEITWKNQYSNLPLKIEMLDADGQKIARGEIPANDSTARHYQMKVSWPCDDSDMTKRDPEYAGKVDLILVQLEASQAD